MSTQRSLRHTSLPLVVIALVSIVLRLGASTLATFAHRSKTGRQAMAFSISKLKLQQGSQGGRA